MSDELRESIISILKEDEGTLSSLLITVNLIENAVELSQNKRIEQLEEALNQAIEELVGWWNDQGKYGTGGYDVWIPELKSVLKGENK